MEITKSLRISYSIMLRIFEDENYNGKFIHAHNDIFPS